MGSGRSRCEVIWRDEILGGRSPGDRKENDGFTRNAEFIDGMSVSCSLRLHHRHISLTSHLIEPPSTVSNQYANIPLYQTIPSLRNTPILAITVGWRNRRSERPQNVRSIIDNFHFPKSKLSRSNVTRIIAPKISNSTPTSLSKHRNTKPPGTYQTFCRKHCEIVDPTPISPQGFVFECDDPTHWQRSPRVSRCF